MAAKTLAELRTSKATALPERTYRMCLSQALVAEVEALSQERDDLTAEAEGIKTNGGRPRKAGQGKSPRQVEIEARFAEIEKRRTELLDEMDAHTGTLRFGAVTAGEWRRWVDANPARIDGKQENGRPIINAIDSEVAYGYCDASALLASLGDYAKAWNDEELGKSDWADIIEPNAAAGDLKELCKLVVQLHEGRGQVPLRRGASSTTQSGESA